MFAAIRIPDFSLTAALWRQAESPAPPRAVAVRAGRASILACVDDESRAQGISPGISTARALARCPHLSILAEDPAAEAAAMGWLIALGSGISPRVEETDRGQVTIDLRGAGDPDDLAVRIANHAAAAGIAVRIGISNTPERAALASFRQSGNGRAETDRALFEGMSPQEVPLPETIRKNLREWGIQDLFAFAQFTKEDVGRRLGPEGVEFWEKMTGRRARLLNVIEEAPSFCGEMELETPIETLEQALFVIRRLLSEVCTSLQAAGRVARSLELIWRTEADVEGRREFTLPEPTARLDPLFAMIETHLAEVRTETALKCIRLQVVPGAPLPRQRDFFEVSTQSPFRFQETLGRIQGILGEGKVGLPVRGGSYHPDDCRTEPAPPQFRVEEGANPYSSNRGPGLRRFRPPRPVEVWCREGRPALCAWNRKSHRILAARGPWRISGDWWDPRYRWSREEWDVEWEHDSFCRLTRRPDGRWFWEGVYD